MDCNGIRVAAISTVVAEDNFLYS